MRARLLPTRSAWDRYGTSPAAPADFTTLFVAYDIALSFTIGANGASSSTSWNEARRLETPVQHAQEHQREPDRQRGGPERHHLAECGEEVVSVGDDEPAHEQGQYRSEDPRRPPRSQVHYRRIVGRA